MIARPAFRWEKTDQKTFTALQTELSVAVTVLITVLGTVILYPLSTTEGLVYSAVIESDDVISMMQIVSCIVVIEEGCIHSYRVDGIAVTTDDISVFIV